MKHDASVYIYIYPKDSQKSEDLFLFDDSLLVRFNLLFYTKIFISIDVAL